VISPTDPGVANWVSTGGLNQGTISIRFQDLDESSSTLPTVNSQVVSLDELASVLPPTTVYVTPQEREEQLALPEGRLRQALGPLPAAVTDRRRPEATPTPQTESSRWKNAR
jgi:hypothetical protein